MHSPSRFNPLATLDHKSPDSKDEAAAIADAVILADGSNRAGCPTIHDLPANITDLAAHLVPLGDGATDWDHVARALVTRHLQAVANEKP